MALYRTDFQGTLYGTEEFQHGMCWSSGDSAVGLAGDIATAWATFLNTADVSPTWVTSVIWSLVNVSELGATPADPIVTSAQATINEAGTATGDSCPPQCCIGLSLRTATAGSRARGRSYLPAPAVGALTGSGRLETAYSTDLLDGLDTFFATMVTANAATPVVISAVGGVWTARNVITIAIGDVLDTQRSRRSGLAEVYATRSV